MTSSNLAPRGFCPDGGADVIGKPDLNAVRKIENWLMTACA
jgi:hypothetical protein